MNMAALSQKQSNSLHKNRACYGQSLCFDATVYIWFIYLLLLPLQPDRILLGVDSDYFWYCSE